VARSRRGGRGGIVPLRGATTAFGEDDQLVESRFPWGARVTGCRTVVLGLLVLIASSNAQAGDGVEVAGDILQYALPATAYGMTAINRDGEGALQYSKAAALTLGVTHALKVIVDEERPDGGGQSFPSGHTSISFSAAEFVRKRYGWEYGAPAYAAAAFVGFSRVQADRHYVHDVVAGAVIGVASSAVFTTPFHGWCILAEAADGRYALVATRSW
jgi:membrane-associated phospholipid phosphatase